MAKLSPHRSGVNKNGNHLFIVHNYLVVNIKTPLTTLGILQRIISLTDNR